MRTKSIFSILAAVFVIAALVPPVLASAAPSAKPALVAAAPTLLKTVVNSRPLNLANGVKGVCNTFADGTQVCYSYTDPQYTNPSYSCPEGSKPIDGDPAHCLVTTTGTIYEARPQVEATYKCPDGFTPFEGGDKPCRKLITAGFWTCPVGDSGPDANGVCTKPAVLSCPGPFTFTDSHQVCPSNDSAYTSSNSNLACKKKINNVWKYASKVTETFGPITVNYGLKSNDPNHCHLDTGVSDTVPDWAMSDFNQQFPELKDISSTPGGTEQGTWHAPVYSYADEVVDVPAHPGDCPDGWTIFSDTQCSKVVTNNETIDATVIAGTPYCKEGTLNSDGKCQTVIPCPPPPPPAPCTVKGLENLPATDPKCVPPSYLPPSVICPIFDANGRDASKIPGCHTWWLKKYHSASANGFDLWWASFLDRFGW